MTEDIQKTAIQKYGSPLYLYDMDQFRLNMTNLESICFLKVDCFFQ